MWICSLSDTGLGDRVSMEVNARTSVGGSDGPSSGLTECKEQGNVAPESSVDSEREEAALNIRARFVSKKDNACGESKESPAGPVQKEDTNMDEPSGDGETTHMEVQTGRNADLLQKNETSASKFLVSSTEDLDEMMDIGTVDQVEQEAQMEEEKQSNSQSLEGDNAQPAISNAGKVRQVRLFFSHLYFEVFFIFYEGVFFCQGCYSLFNL